VKDSPSPSVDETSLKMSEDEKTLFHWNPTSILQISKCIVRGNGPTHTQKKEDYKPCKKKKKREVKHSGELQAARVPYGGRRRLFLRLTTSQFGSNRVDKKFPKDKVCTGAFAEVFCMIFKRDMCRQLEFANTNRQKYGKCAFAIMDGESSK
jgi:hypothetical protein